MTIPPLGHAADVTTRPHGIRAPWRTAVALSLGLALASGAACSNRADGQSARTPQRGSRDLADLATVELVTDAFRQPVAIETAPGDPRVFVVEQAGRIRTLTGTSVDPRPFLDVTDEVRSGGERGLLGLAFHPRFASNGWLFVNYTDRNGDTRIVRYTATRDRRTVDESSAALVLAIEQPYSNHNGGHLRFGPDGMLWIGTGDGGSGGDPHGNGQNPATLLGKMLRIDVDAGDPYAIPADNPFADGRGGRPEVWALGLRNPWRYDFDFETGRLYIADVGQNRWEEVHVEPASQAGINYGWNLMEGRHRFRNGDAPGNLSMPAVEYDHDEGCSITGGVVYHGDALPELAGHYFYSDYCSGWLRSFRYTDGRALEPRTWEVGRLGSVTAFGADPAGELLIATHEGRLFRLVPASPGSR